MEQHDKLKAWMTAKGYNQKSLASELGFSETYIFKLMAGTKPIGSGFKLKFLFRFGVEEATEIFDLQPLPTAANALP